MGARKLRLAGGPCDGLTRPVVPGDWDPHERLAIGVLDEEDGLPHVYDLADQETVPVGATAELVFRYRGTFAPAHSSEPALVTVE